MPNVSIGLDRTELIGHFLRNFASLPQDQLFEPNSEADPPAPDADLLASPAGWIEVDTEYPEPARRITASKRLSVGELVFGIWIQRGADDASLRTWAEEIVELYDQADEAGTFPGVSLAPDAVVHVSPAEPTESWYGREVRIPYWRVYEQ